MSESADRRDAAADLHTHSTASDGIVAPAALVQQASRRGLRVLALTDHDTTTGLAEASAAAGRLGVRFVPGIEITTRVRRGQLHVLGYAINPDWPALREALEWLREGRRKRFARMLEQLEAAGLHLPEPVIPDVSEGESLGRPHVARALVEAGHAASVDDAFERYLRFGRPGYVPRETLVAEDAIDLIRDAGGVAVLAHPLSVFDLEARLPQLLGAGLAGLEAHYGEYSAEQRASLADLARRHSLLVTGGSDFHGPNIREGRNLGSVSWPARDLEQFLARIHHD